MKEPRIDTGDGRCVFAADVHLQPADPDKIARFLTWLDSLGDVPGTHAFILGDLFDFWFPGVGRFYPAYGEVLARLAKASERMDLHFVPGNRDFFLSRDLRRRAPGVRFCSDGLVIESQRHGRIHASHGDELCANDRGYLRFRRFMRSPFLLALALILPASVKKRVVDGLSRNSRRHVTVSSDERLGIPLRQYEALLEHADLVIHGHTHPPRDSAQPAAQVRVLIAWESPEDALILE